jgi:hypothetical protein
MSRYDCMGVGCVVRPLVKSVFQHRLVTSRCRADESETSLQKSIYTRIFASTVRPMKTIFAANSDLTISAFATTLYKPDPRTQMISPKMTDRPVTRLFPGTLLNPPCWSLHQPLMPPGQSLALSISHSPSRCNAQAIFDWTGAPFVL